MSERANPKLVGAFVMIAVVLMVAGIVIFGSGEVFQTKYPYIVFFDGVSGLKAGAPVKFKGVEVGEVKEIRLNVGDTRLLEGDPAIGIPVIFEIIEQRITRRGGPGQLLGEEGVMDSLIQLGLRAQLTLESFVTGRQYIELDMYPGTPMVLVNEPEIPYTEIPTIKTGLEEIQKELQSLVSEIGKARVVDMVAAITEAAQSANAVMSDPGIGSALAALPRAVEQLDSTLSEFGRLATELDTSIVPLRTSLRETAETATKALEQAQATLMAMESAFAPEGRLASQLDATLKELGESARSIRLLMDYLERNPSAILRGKPEEKK